MRTSRSLRRVAGDAQGFTMIVAVGVLLIASLFVAAAFAAVEGDIRLTHASTAQDKAYYAAEAGIQVYLYNLNTNANYWSECSQTPEEGGKKVPVAVPGAADETYTYETLPSTNAPKKECEKGKSISIIESSNSATGTFRVKSVGEATNGTSKEKRTIVATFTHPGFLNYVFLSDYEVEDPATTGAIQEHCEHYYSVRKENATWLKECPQIPFVPEDELSGPFHTNDSVEVCGLFGTNPSFGRKGHEPADKIEMKGGHYGYPGCENSPHIYGEEITEAAPKLEPPETNYELLEAAGAKYSGRTVIELEGEQMKVINAENPKGITVAFPTSGVVYVENAKVGTCPKYSPFTEDESYEEDSACGDIYIKGTYSKSLTIGAQNDVIIVGNLTEASTKGAAVAPSGAATLGLIAQNYVRVFHPVKTPCSGSCTNHRNPGETTGQCTYQNQNEKEGPPEKWGWAYFPAKSGWGSINEPVVDAAILSTKHSWIVDNFFCGNALGTLTVWGAIAQFWRGRVTCCSNTETGYLKSYNYDERLKTSQPPSFLSPTSTGGWKITRQTE